MTKTQNVMDLTIDKPDFLTQLPPELLDIIIGDLFPIHRLERLTEQDSLYPANSLPWWRTNAHPFLALSATSKPLRSAVLAWSQGWLLSHKEVTKYSPDKLTWRKTTASPSNFLRWTSTHCTFCARPSIRKAIFMNGLACCKSCDSIHWPDKITKTDAKKEFGLKDHHLLPQEHAAGKMLVRHPGLPGLRFGRYLSSNVVTTMFLRGEVVALAEVSRGDLKGHLERRRVGRKMGGEVVEVK